MNRLLFLIPLLLLPAFARAAAPTFGQVMWTNDTAKVLLSPERSTNRIQLGTNLVTFGGVSSAFPALWREGTTVNFRLGDNSAFAPLSASLIRSRSLGMMLDTEDSATPFAYSFLFRKKGDTGSTNSALANGAEFGNLQWQGWDGSAFTTAAGWLPKTEQAWVAGASLGSHMELRLIASNTVGFVEANRFVLNTFTNAMILFNGSNDLSPALKRWGRQIQIRAADNSGFADLVASNATLAGPLSVTGQLNVINNVAYTWPSANANGILTNDGAGVLGYLSASVLTPSANANIWTNNTDVIYPWVQSNRFHFGTAATNGARFGLEYWQAKRSLRAGQLSTGTGSDYWDSTNVGLHSIAFGSNVWAGAQGSSVLGGENNTITTNNVYSAIVGGRLNVINQAAGGHNFIGGGISNIISAAASNNVIVGGRGGFIDSNIQGGTVGGGLSNRVQNGGGTVAGGYGNFAGGNACTVAGGEANVGGNTVNTDWAFIGGGRANQVNPDYGTIGGGQTNFIQNNATYGFIGGGHGNDINADIANVPGGSKNIINITSPNSFILGGTSNNVASTVAAAGVIGNFGTNANPGSILISPRGTHGSNNLHVTATASTNIGPLFVRSGWSTSFARVGGWLTNDVTVRTNHTGSGAFTNLASYIVPAHALSNTSDTVIFYLRGNFQFARATTNDFKAIYGTVTVFDTGFKEASNCTWEAVIEVTRTGNASQIIGSKVNWIMNGAAGVANNGALSTWATNSVTAVDNGVTNIFVFQGASRTASTITNDLFKVEWQGHPNF